MLEGEFFINVRRRIFFILLVRWFLKLPINKKSKNNHLKFNGDFKSTITFERTQRRQ
jgi:hypothetical protein